MKISLLPRPGSLLFALLFCVSCVSGYAQPVTVKGILRTSSGEPFFNVSVKAISERKEVFTGPDGMFTIEVSPLSVIRVSFPGYVVCSINVRYAPIDTSIVLMPDRPDAINAAHVTEDRKQQDLQSALSGPRGNANIYGAGINPSSSLMPVFSQKENTEGSRYLNNHWVKGYVVNAEKSVIDNFSFFYNYDKITGELLISQDKRTAVSIGKEQVSSFYLIDDMRDSIQFTIIPEINNRFYTAVLVNSGPFRLYRLIETQFNKADYHTDGMTETGNKFDEYADVRSYYIQQAGSERYEKLKLTRKSLQTFFPKTASINEYFSSHNFGKIDELFITELVNAANGKQ